MRSPRHSHPHQFTVRRLAAQYVTVFTIATVVTIAGTRAYLKLTGYPQIGGAVFHFAHALWGGLALAVTTLLLLISSNEKIRWFSAILGGVGWALFVDEVGKFITQKNDYFFPLAAPIVYVTLVILALVTHALVRVTRQTPHAHLHAALELTAHIIDGQGTRADAIAARQHCQAAITSSDPSLARIAQTIDTALEETEQHLTESHSAFHTIQTRLVAWEQRYLPVDRQRKLARLLLSFLPIFGALIIAASISTVFDSETTDTVNAVVAVNGYTLGSLSQVIASLGYLTWVIGGALALVAVRAMSPKRKNYHRARQYGTASLLILIVLGNGLLSYVDQFSTLADLLYQITALILLNRWADRSEFSEETSRVRA